MYCYYSPRHFDRRLRDNDKNNPASIIADDNDRVLVATWISEENLGDISIFLSRIEVALQKLKKDKYTPIEAEQEPAKKTTLEKPKQDPLSMTDLLNTISPNDDQNKFQSLADMLEKMESDPFTLLSEEEYEDDTTIPLTDDPSYEPFSMKSPYLSDSSFDSLFDAYESRGGDRETLVTLMNEFFDEDEELDTLTFTQRLQTYLNEFEELTAPQDNYTLLANRRNILIPGYKHAIKNGFSFNRDGVPSYQEFLQHAENFAPKLIAELENSALSREVVNLAAFKEIKDRAVTPDFNKQSEPVLTLVPQSTTENKAKEGSATQRYNLYKSRQHRPVPLVKGETIKLLKPQ